MKRAVFIAVFVLLIIQIYSLSQAQLINYGRRSKFLRATTNPEIAEEDAIPQWAQELVEPQSTEERRYDVNRDNLLQTSEVKVYLRDIIKRVENREYIYVVTDLLREYDKNEDGVINSYELDLMKEHVK